MTSGIASVAVDYAAAQAPPRAPYRRRGRNSPAPAESAATPKAPALTEAAAIRRLIRRLILQGSLPTTSPHTGLTVAQFNAKQREALAAASSPHNWANTGRLHA